MTEYADTATLGYGGSCDGRSLSQDQQVRDISHPCYMALASVIRSIRILASSPGLAPGPHPPLLAFGLNMPKQYHDHQGSPTFKVPLFEVSRRRCWYRFQPKTADHH